VVLAERALGDLPDALAAGRILRGSWRDHATLVAHRPGRVAFAAEDLYFDPVEIERTFVVY